MCQVGLLNIGECWQVSTQCLWLRQTVFCCSVPAAAAAAARISNETSLYVTRLLGVHQFHPFPNAHVYTHTHEWYAFTCTTPNSSLATKCTNVIVCTYVG